jgi:hypothetical protein
MTTWLVVGIVVVAALLWAVVSVLERIASGLERVAEGIRPLAYLDAAAQELVRAYTRPCAECGAPGSAYREGAGEYYCDECVTRTPYA